MTQLNAELNKLMDHINTSLWVFENTSTVLDERGVRMLEAFLWLKGLQRDVQTTIEKNAQPQQEPPQPSVPSQSEPTPSATGALSYRLAGGKKLAHRQKVSKSKDRFDK